MTDNSDGDAPILLALTVGGSPAPLEHAIYSLAARHLVLIASDGGGHSSEPQAVRLGLETVGKGAFEVLTLPADDVDAGFERLVSAFDRLARTFPSHRLIANYTGGTKSMSAALLMAAFDRGVEVQITTGAREDLVRVTDGTETGRMIQTRLMRLEADLTSAVRLGASHDFGAAQRLLESIAAEVKQRNVALSADQRARLAQALSWARCLSAWDRFDHGQAQKRWLDGRRAGHPWAIDLETAGAEDLLRALASGDPAALCADLLANARRRYDQGRYDDAVGRLYRCLEACADLRLRHLRVDREALRNGDIPGRHGRDPRGPAGHLGLWEMMQILQTRERVGLSAAYLIDGKNGPRWVKARHDSILAHGYTAVRAEVAQQAFRWVEDHLLPVMKFAYPPAWPADPFRRRASTATSLSGSQEA